MAWIYLITNDINGKQYVGKTYYKSIQERWHQHLNDYKKQNCEKRPLYNAMNKYGIEHFHIKEIEYVLPEMDLEKREIYWINQYDTYHNGYNATLGGDGKRVYNYDELIAAYKELKNLTKVANIFHCDTGHLSKILKANNIKIISGQQISQQMNGKQVAQYDLNDNFIQIFPSSCDAAKALNKITSTSRGASSHIADACKGKRKTAYGYKWKFVDKN